MSLLYKQPLMFLGFRKMLFKDIAETNLVLVSVINSPTCVCDREPFELRRRKKEYKTHFAKCDRMLFQKHRSRPPNCQNFHEKVRHKRRLFSVLQFDPPTSPFFWKICENIRAKDKSET